MRDTIHLYEQGKISSGIGAQVLGCDRLEFYRLHTEPFYKIEAMIYWNVDELNRLLPNKPQTKYAKDIHYNEEKGIWERRVTTHWKVSFMRPPRNNKSYYGDPVNIEKFQGLNLDHLNLARLPVLVELSHPRSLSGIGTPAANRHLSPLPLSLDLEIRWGIPAISLLGRGGSGDSRFRRPMPDRLLVGSGDLDPLDHVGGAGRLAPGVPFVSARRLAFSM